MVIDWHKPSNVQSIADLTVYAEDISITLEEVTTATTLTVNHFLVLVDASGGIILITLPAAASHANRMYTIKKIDSSNNKVTIDANATEKIDGELTLVIGLQYSYVTIVCDGDEWFIIGGRNVKLEDLLEKYLGIQVDNQDKMINKLTNIETHLSLGSDEELEQEG